MAEKKFISLFLLGWALIGPTSQYHLTSRILRPFYIAIQDELDRANSNGNVIKSHLLKSVKNDLYARITAIDLVNAIESELK